MTPDDRIDNLREAIAAEEAQSDTTAVAVAAKDYETGWTFGHQDDRIFHAASTIKLAILLAVLKLVDDGALRWNAPLLVHNRFRSIVDGSIFRVSADSDGCPSLYKLLGRTAKISELAEQMIASSSNLATNLLIELAGEERAARIVADAGVRGVTLRRGVEDDNAHEHGLDNQTTASGLVSLLEIFRGDFLSRESRDHAVHILLQQRFTSMIPAGLPPHATVAHKTGEISTVCHDAGIVYLPEREPYIVAILTEVSTGKDGRREAVARLSRAVYEAVTGRSA